MNRVLASTVVRPSMRKLASPCPLLGQRWTPPVPRPQPLRSFSVLDKVPFVRQRRVDESLKAELDQALSIKDPEQKRRVFFDVARRFAANNGSDVEFKSPGVCQLLETFEYAVARLPPDRKPETACQCSVDAIGSHNMRYAVDMVKPSRWKVWVVVDAELRPLPGSDSRIISKREALDAHLTTAIVVIIRHVLEETQSHFAGDTGDTRDATHGEAGFNGRIADKLDIEILVWDTVIPLEVDTRTGVSSTHWVGKVGERRPWKDGWFPVIIPIPFFFDL